MGSEFGVSQIAFCYLVGIELGFGSFPIAGKGFPAENAENTKGIECEDIADV